MPPIRDDDRSMLVWSVILNLFNDNKYEKYNSWLIYIINLNSFCWHVAGMTIRATRKEKIWKMKKFYSKINQGYGRILKIWMNQLEASYLIDDWLF